MEVCILLWQFYDHYYLNKARFASYRHGLSATVPADWIASRKKAKAGGRMMVSPSRNQIRSSEGVLRLGNELTPVEMSFNLRHWREHVSLPAVSASA
jgi:hypothetical protein